MLKYLCTRRNLGTVFILFRVFAVASKSMQRALYHFNFNYDEKGHDGT